MVQAKACDQATGRRPAAVIADNLSVLACRPAAQSAGLHFAAGDRVSAGSTEGSVAQAV